MSKTCAVIGLGKFGFYVAKGLFEQGVDVIAIDKNEEATDEISEFIDTVYTLDATDKKALQQAGIAGLDMAIVGMGSDIEASILTVMALKELGNENIVAKASTSIHAKILTKIGALRIVYPEREVGKKLVEEIAKGVIFEVFDISNRIKIIKTIPPKSMVGKPLSTIEDLDYDLNICAYKNQDKWHHKDLDLMHEMTQEDIIVILGSENEIDKFYKEIV